MEQSLMESRSLPHPANARSRSWPLAEIFLVR